jgi:hypothetical protein
MAKRSKKAQAEKKAEPEGAAVLPGAGTPGGLPLHSGEGGPRVSEATTVDEAYADPDAEPEEAKAKGPGTPKGAVKITTRNAKIYTKFGRTFRSDGFGSDAVEPDEFSDEQWSELRASPYLTIGKAGKPETDL